MPESFQALNIQIGNAAAFYIKLARHGDNFRLRRIVIHDGPAGPSSRTNSNGFYHRGRAHPTNRGTAGTEDHHHQLQRFVRQFYIVTTFYIVQRLISVICLPIL